MKLTFNGFDGLLKALDSKVNNLNPIKKAVSVNGSEMQKNAMRKAPVDTSFLEGSIKYYPGDGGFTAKVKPEADYAAYVEYGTRFMNARPFMRPSFYKQVNKFKSDLQRLMG